MEKQSACLNATRELDAIMVSKMIRPHCGVADTIKGNVKFLGTGKSNLVSDFLSFVGVTYMSLKS